MQKKTWIKITFVCLMLIGSATYYKNTSAITENETASTEMVPFEQKAQNVYNLLNEKNLDYEAFSKAYKGFIKLAENGTIKNRILSIVDFTRSANQDRLYVINMDSLKLEYKSLVAHGKNSGEEFAEIFSNSFGSNQSSLGFFVTGETYEGKHGYSLRLDGLEPSNNKARDRAIVVHAADYVSPDFISKNGRLGRSHGCPALPPELNENIINLIKEGSCLFLYYPSEDYLFSSTVLKERL